MNIIYASNDHYARHLGVSLCSLFDSNQDAPGIDVYILDTGISSDSRRKLDAIARRYCRTIHYAALDGLKERIPFPVDTGRFDISTLGRLFIGEMLPQTVERCIYLDCDTVVLCSLKHLWKTPLGAMVAGAVQEPTIYRQVKEIIGLSREDPYYNAGMLLIDLAVWRQEHLGKRMMEYYQSQGGRLPANDQDVINHVLKGRIRTLPPRYNFFPNYRYFSYKALTAYAPVYKEVPQKQFTQAKKHPVILHYMGDERPWIAGNLNHYRLAYDWYLARTGWEKTPREKGKRLYMLAYHMLDYITVICPALRWEIGKRIGMRMLGERKQ